MTLCFIDTETTGLDPVLHEVWEVAVILRDRPPDHAELVGDGAADRWLSSFVGEGAALMADPPPLGVERGDVVSRWRRWVVEHPEEAVRLACGVDRDAVVRGLLGGLGTTESAILELLAPLDQANRGHAIARVLQKLGLQGLLA